MEIPELGEYSPLQIFGILLLLNSVIEFGIMVILQVAGLNLLPLSEALLDSVLLTVFIAPAAYLLLIKPLMQRSREEIESMGTDLEESEEKYRTVVESSTDAIVSADGSRRIVQWNEAATEMFGYSEEEALGQSTDIIVPEQIREDHVEGFERFVETEEPRLIGRNYETRGLRKDGSTFPIELSLSSARRAGGFFFTAIIRDVSELEERDRQLQVLDRFLRHNLHSEMNLILGYADNLFEKTGEEEAEMIKETANKLTNTTDKEKEIVDLISREGNLEVLDVKELVERAVAKVESEYPGADVTVSLPQEEALEVEGLPELERALYELMENAVVHAKPGELEVEVCAESEGAVEISVKDKGERIPEAEVQVLKKKDEITSLQHGSGLGLLLVRWVVTRSHGKLEFQENEPSGNIVTLHLPRPDETISG